VRRAGLSAALAKVGAAQPETDNSLFDKQVRGLAGAARLLRHRVPGFDSLVVLQSSSDSAGERACLQCFHI